MRTGQKVALAHFICAMVLSFFTVIGGVVLGLIFSEARAFWPHIPLTVGAILGPAGFNLSMVEARKALESGGLSDMARRFRKKKGDGEE